MKLTVKVDTRLLTAALLKAPSAVRSVLRKEMGQQMADVAKEAALVHRYKTQSGNLDRSIQSSVSNGGLVGTVQLVSGLAPYGIYQHEGTGIYGPKHAAYEVKPTNKKALHWGGKFFSKGHKINGIKKNQFVYNAFKNRANEIVDGLEDAVNRALKKVGLI
jgi:hypothetical protein